MTTPTRLNAGFSLAWVASFPGFTASEGWSLSYQLTNHTNAHTIPATALGDDFQVVISPALSSTFAPGSYRLFAIAQKADDRRILANTSFEVLPDITKAVDLRSTAERTLEAIEALLEGKATDDQQMIQYNGRTLSRYTFEALETLRSRLKRTVARERERRRGSKGRIGVKF